ncbi:uncharacterized protein LOC115456363 isoform X3 [Manduca sexta]|uniref:Uncharacterized protein n=1 Tax=Manduca sexta TaxID=7130 RepID=A0A921YQR7_MANSE|nr:uncharacterized protein LOC115456363 isoform X3 [Manduca sexta]KAG6444091.1 hypothetical protein O3G_MSEX003227 [Manduca sexta]
MFSIKTIVIIIAVNIVKAERENKHTDSEEKIEPHILPAANIRQLNGKRSADTSLGPSDDYGSIEYDEMDNEHSKRFADNQDEQINEDRNSYLEEKNTDDEERSANANGDNRNDKDENIDSTKSDMMTHHVILDTKGRSATEDAMQEDFKSPVRDVRRFEDPRLGIIQNTNHQPCSAGNKVCRSITDPSRSGFLNSYFPTMSRPGLLQPLYTVQHPLLQTNPELPTPFLNSPIIEKENLPFVNINSYPYQTPLTRMVETDYQAGSGLDVLKKLVEATNSALTPNEPVAYLENYPMNLPGRFRRSAEIKINPLVTIVLPKGQQLDKIPRMINWGKIYNFCC